MAASTSSSEARRRTFALVVEYDGTDLVGWQRQKNGPSVQEHLERALAQMIEPPPRVTGASRTDAGVHALGQVAAFTATTRIPTDGLRQGLNSHLPDSIAVRSAREVPAAFHPRFDARGKHYRYAILNRQERSPLLRRITWHRPRRLDLPAMREAAGHLPGEHDFSAFRAAGCQARHPVREVTAVRVADAGDALVYIDVRGNAFLRNMVRIIAGTLVEVGVGKLAPDQLPAILASADRDRAGPTAPAHGLTLVEVFYE